LNSLGLQFYRAFLRLRDFPRKSRLEGLLRRRIAHTGATYIGAGVKMWLDPQEWAQRDLLALGQAEPLTTALFQKLLAAGDTFVDVGCHVGYHSLRARLLLGDRGRVVAMDPQPYNCERTLMNWRINGFTNIAVYTAAVGETPGTIRLAHQPPSDRSRLSLLHPTARGSAPTFNVPIYTLKQIIEFEALQRIKLLKIDTEGYEAAVLTGLGAEISQVDNIILELLPESRYPGGAAEAICSLLRAAGFDLRTVESKPWMLSRTLPENNLWATRTSTRI